MAEILSSMFPHIMYEAGDVDLLQMQACILLQHNVSEEPLEGP